MQHLLAQALREGRIQARLTQLAVAKAIGVSRAAVGQWEAGTNEPSTENLVLVCRALGIEVESALKGIIKKSQSALISSKIEDPIATNQSFSKIMNEQANERFRKIHSDPSDTLFVYGTHPYSDEGYTYISKEPVSLISRPLALVGSKNDYVIVVSDDYLYPKFEKDEYLYVSGNSSLRQGDYAVIRTGSFEEMPNPNGSESVEVERCIIGRFAGYDVFGAKIQQFKPFREMSIPIADRVAVHRVRNLHHLIVAVDAASDMQEMLAYRRKER